VPVQVIAPAGRRLPDPEGDAEDRRRHGLAGRAPQHHARRLRRAQAFPFVARHARRDDVGPVPSAALRGGYAVNLPEHHNVIARCQSTIVSGSYVAFRSSVCSIRSPCGSWLLIDASGNWLWPPDSNRHLPG
jgi:hypothetical protein